MTAETCFSDLFAPESTPPRPANDALPWTILLVDDEPDIHAVLRLALQGVETEGRQLRLLDAYSGSEAQTILTQRPDIALVLLDVVMETDRAGLDLVRYIRQGLNNQAIQIVLVTGQPGYAPERRVVADYDINGYRLKSELTADRIFVSVHAALRAYRIVHELEQQRSRLEAQTQALARWRHIFEHAEWGIVVVGADGRTIELANPAFARDRDYGIEEMLGRTVEFLYPAAEDALHARHVESAWASGHEVFESTHLRKDGSEFPVLVDITAVRDDQDRALYLVVNVQDITERKQAEEQITYVMRELSHRTKNVLAVVQSVAWQTARTSRDLDDFQDRFNKRIGALTCSHDLLVRGDWKGIRLDDLVRGQLRLFAAEGHLDLDGPDLMLRPQSAQTLGFALHELATNALKYGALSDLGGKVEVTWALDAKAGVSPTFRMRWQETGGPVVTPPARKGFGNTVIKDMTERAFSGEVTLEFAPSGLVWRLVAPAGGCFATSEAGTDHKE